MEEGLRKLIILSCISFAFSSKVPVLLWSSSRSLADLPQTNSGKTIVSTDFTQHYLNPLTKGKDGNLVVFVQDKLSLQDFTQHADVYNPESDGGVFKNIKGFMDELSSVSLPSVHLPSLAVDDMTKTFKGKVHQVEGHDIGKVNIDSNVPNLIIVTLTSILDSPNEKEGFRRNDEAIGKVIRQLSKGGVRYTAVYTARDSQVAENKAALTKRRLLSTDMPTNITKIANGTLLNFTCVLVYIRSINIVANNVSYYLNDTNKFIGSNLVNCTNDTAEVHVIYDDPQLKMDMSMNMTMGNASSAYSGYWKVNSTTITLNDSVTDNLRMDSVSAPEGFSYHCSSLAGLTKHTGGNVTVSFDGFQLQPFGVKNSKFSDGWDCIPFFTEVIWMGIIAMLVVTLILLFGFSMLSSINTQDRFDDPKGKTITVNVSD
ncbi:V-type proton ATPase subunit S1-like isoform X2 [Ostrea edulis]|uniref:V-type proton ATPase subunit S1-like isoform X2 n=1 Tax=Ostrea edulis TaxID=37623 RepID=UPI0024AEB387|nr:V-type proton ATPase subunit S1-like isoform X2 [Ostrea edulis]